MTPYRTIADFIRDRNESFEDVMFVFGMICTDPDIPDSVKDDFEIAADALVKVQKMANVDVTDAPERIQRRIDLFMKGHSGEPTD